MSYFAYMACSRELPIGMFGLPPKAVYDSYRQYRDSPDFTVPIDFMTGEPIDMGTQRAQRLDRLQGKVAVYEKAMDARSAWITPYRPIITHRGDDVFEASAEDMAKHFSQPFLYNVEGDYVEYLCKYLQVGDRAEVYICWAGEEKHRFGGEKRIVDLERIVKGDRGLCKFDPSKGNAFTVYLAPSEPMTSSELVSIPQIDYVVWVVQENRSQLVDLSALQDQGLW